MTSSLFDMNARRAQWLNEKPSFTGGNELRVQRDDLIIFQFIASGNDGDAFIKAYKAHAIDTVSSKTGKPFSINRFCAVQSGEGNECSYCQQQIGGVKERFSMWMWVTNILHTTMPAEKTFPQINHQNRLYFNEEPTTEVNGVATPGAFKVWHTSAWRESPWDDIVNLAGLYQGLHNFTAQMAVVGDQMQRRYKVYAIPNSPFLTPELYERAKAECTPIPQLLNEQLASPVVAAPVQPANNNAPQGTSAIVSAWQPPGNSVPSLGFSPPASFTTPAEPSAPVVKVAPVVQAPEPPVAAPVAETPPPVEAPQVEAPKEEAPPATAPAEDAKRPMKALF